MVDCRIYISIVLGCFAVALSGCGGCSRNTAASKQPTAQQQNTGILSVDPVVDFHAKQAARMALLIELPKKPHWKLRRSPKFDVVYMGDQGDVYYVRQITDESEVPTVDDLKSVRNFYRKLCIEENGGIVQVEVQQVQGQQAAICYSKQIVKGIRGYRYIARCVLSVGDGWQEVRMDAIQMGVTGMRESIATMSMGKDIETEPVPANAAAKPGGTPRSGGTRIEGFYLDPYDKAHDNAAMNSIADDVKYDEAVKTHPLSRLRRTFPTLLESITLPATR